MSDMEWEDLNPIVKTVPWAKAWVTVIKDGKPRLNITFSEPTMKDCGYPEKANVMVGTKDGKTMIRLVWTEGGKFTVKKMELGGGRIHGIPCGTMKSRASRGRIALRKALGEPALPTRTLLEAVVE